MASINFGGEAAESFANLLQYIRGFTVEVVPDPDNDPAGNAEPFDATVIGSAADVTGDYYGVLVRKLSDGGDPVGEPFAVVVRELRVY